MKRDNHEEIERAYGDAIYEAWCCGLNPDQVNRDCVEDFYYDSYDADEAASCEVNRIRQESQHENDREE